MMKRYLQYIFITLLTGVITVSCLEELEPETPIFESEVLTLVPRVQSFANQYVTKSDDNDAEIKRLAVLIFNNGGKLVHIQEFTDLNNATAVNINKTMLNLNNPTAEQALTEATVVMLANIQLTNIKKSETETLANVPSNLTLEELEDYTYNVTDDQSVITTKPSSGFPMAGNAKVDLSHTSTKTLAVELSILYAKINFSISVTEGAENKDPDQVSGVSFTLNKYEVNNVAKEITLMKPEEETDVDSYYSGFIREPKVTTDLGNNSNPLTFTFYMLESRYEHNLSDTQISSIYPWGTSAGYEKYKQMYKPKLVTNSGKGIASNVLLSGTYTDYRGTQWGVDYTIYLGKDNALNFHVDRNSEYTNIITIKGIRNSNEYGAGQVWLDHRVDVTYKGDGADDHIKITRETLIDSHIEVRPLRVSLSNTDYAAAQILLPDVEWIAAERFTGINCTDASLYCYNNKGESIGKRRYFTTDLIPQLKESEGSTIYLFDNECAWIYFDENISPDSRKADITIKFLDSNGNVQDLTETYTIVQQGLENIPIKNEDGNLIANHIVESYEEYLHSYDSADKYNLSTSPVDYSQQGLAWGYSGESISEDIIVSATPLQSSNIDIALDWLATRDYFYDYFHSKDVTSGTYYSYVQHNDKWTATTYGTGFTFTDRASENLGIKIMDMGTIPSSAYQYCLSKNKFKEDKDGVHTLDMHWYLPDAYELQEVLKYTQNEESSVADFGKDSWYWSSQPSTGGFTINGVPIIGDISLKDENQTNARAVLSTISQANPLPEIRDIDRTEQHRIRCFYDPIGKEVNMSNRVPDGIGGNHTIYMKAWYNGSAGYFNSYMMQEATRTNNEDNPEYESSFSNNNYLYPTVASPGAGDIFESFSAETQGGSTVKGFRLYPLNMDLWQGYKKTENTGGIFDYEEFTYYKVLATFPGLSGYELKYDDGYGGDGGARPLTDKPRKETEIKNYHYTARLDKTLTTSSNLKPLDPDNKLNISFSNNTNSQKNPIFNYDELSENSRRITSTREWRVPTYQKSTYTPKKGNDTESFNGEGSASAEREQSWFQWNKTESETIQEAENKALENALTNAMSKAQSKYIGRTCEVVAGSNKITITGGSWRKNLLGQKVEYTATASGTVNIRCYDPVDPTPQTYYMDASNGGWSDPKSSDPEYLDKIKTDELKMFCGNSFTISLSESAKDQGYVITKVKVYISGGNLVADNLDVGLITRQITTSARFVDSVLIPEDGLIAREQQGYLDFGLAETISLPGMEYSENSDNGEVWQQWSGLSSSVTLALADYEYNRIVAANSAAQFTYKRAETDLSKYVVIDRIEVKCTRNSTGAN